MHSPDLTAANIDKIAELFPNVITETIEQVDGKDAVIRAVDFDLLRQELSDHIVEGPQERYQLDWPGKRAAAFAANAPIAKTLRPVREESVDFDTTKNIFIEGDNLDALKLLQESYLGKVKLIYIDPPYNTGNDFVYDDDFRDSTREYLAKSTQIDDNGLRLVANSEAGGRYHSNWLTMIYSRLKLARRILADDGMIFVSIDEHEVHNLRAVMSEIFGAKNFVGLITRATGTPTGGGFDGLTNMVDYMVVFRRSDSATINGLEFGESDALIYNEEDERGMYLVRSLRRTGGEDRREDRPSMYFAVSAPDGSPVFPIGPGGYESRWICGQEKYQSMLSDGLIQWKLIGDVGSQRWHPYQKFYLDGREKRPSNLWTDVDGNKKGTRELRSLFDGEKVFDSPKPVALIERVIQIATEKDSIVVDFFAGSGTTGQAVLACNASDGGSRRFILVQLPELTPPDSPAAQAGFASIPAVTRQRLRRSGAASGVGAQLVRVDVGFRALRLEESVYTDVGFSPDGTVQGQLGLLVDSIKADRNGEDVLFQVLLDWGLELSLPITVEQHDGHDVFVVDGGALVACFEKTVTLGVVTAMAQLQPLRAVFRDSAFADDAARINAEQIFRELSPTTDVKAI